MIEHSCYYPISLMARVLGVSRSGYYWWLERPPTARENRYKLLGPLIVAAHELGRATYSSARIKDELAAGGVVVGRDQISMLRKELGLKCIQHKKFKATTNSNHDLPVAPNVLNQTFETRTPGTVWGNDITYIPTDEGWLYLAGIKDFGSCEIVGYAMGPRMTKVLVRDALKHALAHHTPLPGCISHSDKGSQYCALEYQNDLKKAGFTASMSRRGNCYDNAPMESFWSSLKNELIYQRRFETRLQAQAAVQEYIEIFYNRIRRHTSLGNLSPAVYTQNYYKERRSA
jgi:putative transposase